MDMPRIARGQLGGVCGHVVNRGNERQRVFRDEQNYAAFVELIGRACERTPMRVVGRRCGVAWSVAARSAGNNECIGLRRRGAWNPRSAPPSGRGRARGSRKSSLSPFIPQHLTEDGC